MRNGKIEVYKSLKMFKFRLNTALKERKREGRKGVSQWTDNQVKKNPKAGEAKW